MAKPKVTVLVGSNRTGSVNQALANALAKLGKDRLDISFSKIDDLPMFSQNIEKEPPEAVERLKAEVKAADGVLLVTPEYNRSIPALLKNAIDWINRPGPRNDWKDKPAAVAGATKGAIGTAVAQQVLRMTLLGAGAVVMGQPTVYFTYKDEMFDDDGNLVNDDTKKFLGGFMDGFAGWIEKVG